MNLKIFVIYMVSVLTLTACESNSSVPRSVQNPINTESVTEPIPEVKTPDGKIITLVPMLMDLPSSQLNKVAQTPIIIASDTEISLENPKELKYIFYKKNELDGPLYGEWENITEQMPAKGSIKVPTEKGTFDVLLSTDMKSYLFAIEVR